MINKSELKEMFEDILKEHGIEDNAVLTDLLDAVGDLTELEEDEDVVDTDD